MTNVYEIEKRNQIASEIGAEIRSFDYITDRTTKRTIYPYAWTSDGIEDLEYELANPFYKAVNDSTWKKFCKLKQIGTFHFYSRHCLDVLSIRKYST